jgi:hypothetical protein
MNAAGGAFGVLIGGLLTEYAGWRWVMFVNLPIVACALAVASRGVATDPAPVRGDRPDVLGAALVTAGMSLLVFGVVRTDRYPWGSAVTVTTLAAAVALLALFVHVERTTTREPLVRLGLLARRSVAGANAYNLLVGAAMAAAFYFVSLYLQQVLRTGAALTGVEFLPFALAVIAGSVLAVKLGDRLAPRTLLAGGGLLTAIGFAWFGLISPDGSFAADVLGALALRRPRLRALSRTGRRHRHRGRRAARERYGVGSAHQLTPDRRLARAGRSRHRRSAPHRPERHSGGPRRRVRAGADAERRPAGCRRRRHRHGPAPNRPGSADGARTHDARREPRRERSPMTVGQTEDRRRRA